MPETTSTFTENDRKELIKLGFQMAQVGEDISELKSYFKDELEAARRVVQDHEARIRKLEARMWWVAGAAAGLGAASHFLLHLVN